MKKGFTLIELLAVIVILAIIALIATPIIINIIEDAKGESEKRSIEMYAYAVEQAVVKENLTREFNPSSCIINDNSTLTCDGESLKVEVNGNIPSSGTIRFTNGIVTYMQNLKFNDTAYMHLVNGEILTTEEEKSEMDLLCSPVPQTLSRTYTAGAKYECKVDPNKEAYTFYVLTTPEEDDTTVDLIMTSNINESGEAIDGTQIQGDGFVAWASKTDYNDDANYGSYGNNNKGPITAMKYLAESTKNWTTLSPMTYTYDETAENRGGTYGYNKLEINNGVGKIYAKGDNTIGTSITLIDGTSATIRARMPKPSELEENSLWLLDNLDFHIVAYWTLSSNAFDSHSEALLKNNRYIFYPSSYFENVDTVEVGFDIYNYIDAATEDWDYFGIGIRPVITLSI